MRGLLALLIACGSESTSAPTSGRDEAIVEAMPSIAGAKILIPSHRVTTSALVVWCVDEADALGRVTAQLAREEWTNIETHGYPSHQAVAARRGGLRFSAQIGGPNDHCGGHVINASVLRLGDAPDQ